MKYLNAHKEDLFNGKKVTYRGKVYWANMVTREIYAMSVEAEMSGVINGYKVADITDDWQIVPPMKRYTVKEEYIDLWGSNVYADTVIREDEVERLAVAWETPIEELLEQLTEV